MKDALDELHEGHALAPVEAQAVDANQATNPVLVDSGLLAASRIEAAPATSKPSYSHLLSSRFNDATVSRGRAGSFRTIANRLTTSDRCR